MKVLVTGAAGYIGSHICKRYKDQGHTVIGLDRHFRSSARFYTDVFIPEDFASPTAFYAIEQNKPDVVIHCGAKSSVGPDVVDPGPYYLNNVAKTVLLLECIRKLPEKPVFLFSSSAAVYGDLNVDNIKEYYPKNPINPYGHTKLAVEQILENYSKSYGLKTLSLRYFNVCGAALDGSLGQRKDAPHIITKLLNAVKTKEPFILNGNSYETPDGTCIRDYIHIEDVVSAHLSAAKRLLDGYATNFALNLGSGVGTSNRELVDAVNSQIGPVNLIIGQKRGGDPARLVAYIDAVKLALNWQPRYSDLQTILATSWKWLKDL